MTRPGLPRTERGSGRSRRPARRAESVRRRPLLKPHAADCSAGPGATTDRAHNTGKAHADPARLVEERGKRPEEAAGQAQIKTERRAAAAAKHGETCRN